MACRRDARVVGRPYFIGLLIAVFMVCLSAKYGAGRAADFPVLERKDCAKDPRVTGKCRWVYGRFGIGANGLCYIWDSATLEMISPIIEPLPGEKGKKYPETSCYSSYALALGYAYGLGLFGRYLFCPFDGYHDFAGWDRWDQAGCVARAEDVNVMFSHDNDPGPSMEEHFREVGVPGYQ